MRSYVLGIDEVGRGPLAGPVTLGAFVLPIGFDFSHLALSAGLPIRDSKKLKVFERESWYFFVREFFSKAYSVCSVSQRMIDRYGMRSALTYGARRVFLSLLARLPETASVSVFLDGSLYLPGQVKTLLSSEVSFLAHGLRRVFRAQTVIRGDERLPIISLASIMAKVHRDDLMRRYDARYPGYDFFRHKGYGTRKHLEVLSVLGPSPIHRLTFISKYLKVTQKLSGRS